MEKKRSTEIRAMATSKKPEKLCMVLQTDDKGAN